MTPHNIEVRVMPGLGGGPDRLTASASISTDLLQKYSPGRYRESHVAQLGRAIARRIERELLDEMARRDADE